jgi:hypothetical protein
MPLLHGIHGHSKKEGGMFVSRVYMYIHMLIHIYMHVYIRVYAPGTSVHVPLLHGIAWLQPAKKWPVCSDFTRTYTCLYIHMCVHTPATSVHMPLWQGVAWLQPANKWPVCSEFPN